MSLCKLGSTGILTHWGRVTHICVSDLTIIGSDNGLSPGRRQAIIKTNAGILLIRPLGTNFSEILIEIIIFSFKKMRLKVSSAKRRPFCLGLNVLNSWEKQGTCHHLQGWIRTGDKPLSEPTMVRLATNIWSYGVPAHKSSYMSHLSGQQICSYLWWRQFGLLFLAEIMPLGAQFGWQQTAQYNSTGQPSRLQIRRIFQSQKHIW